MSRLNKIISIKLAWQPESLAGLSDCGSNLPCLTSDYLGSVGWCGTVEPCPLCGSSLSFKKQTSHTHSIISFYSHCFLSFFPVFPFIHIFCFLSFLISLYKFSLFGILLSSLPVFPFILIFCFLSFLCFFFFSLFSNFLFSSALFL